MQALCLLVCFLAGPSVHRLRPLDPWAAAAIQLGLDRSPTIRGLIAELDQSDLIVYVETRSEMPFAVMGMVRLAASTDTHRYLRIVLLRDPLPVRQTAVLGHELHHAREIARANVRDAPGLRALYEAIGHRALGGPAAYETQAAVSAGHAVWYELSGDDRRAARFRAGAARD